MKRKIAHSDRGNLVVSVDMDEGAVWVDQGPEGIQLDLGTVRWLIGALDMAVQEHLDPPPPDDDDPLCEFGIMLLNAGNMVIDMKKYGVLPCPPNAVHYRGMTIFTELNPRTTNNWTKVTCPQCLAEKDNFRAGKARKLALV